VTLTPGDSQVKRPWATLRRPFEESRETVNPWGRVVGAALESTQLSEADRALESIKEAESELVESLAVEYRRIDLVSDERAREMAESMAKYFLDLTIGQAGSSDDYLERLRKHVGGLRALPVRASALKETK
jgi:hypothetical protein